LLATTITIASTTYDATARAANGFVGIDQLTRCIDGYDELEFHILGCTPEPPFVPGQAVSLSTDDGSGAVLRFTGDILGPVEMSQSETGWSFSYRCIGLKRRGDYITLLSSDGSGVATFNLPLDDEDYLLSTAGKSVGQIVTILLTNVHNSANLAAVGIGAYTSMGPPAVLPAQTIADLALCTIVPNTDVRLEGECLISVLDQFIRAWHPQYSTWVEPDGTIRVASPFAFPPQTLTVPGGTAAGDPVNWPQCTIDASTCYTRYQIVGKDIGGTVLSVHDGSLERAWTGAQQTAWTLSDFTSPKGSVDSGTLSSVTTTSAVVTSDFPAAHWVVNYWNGGEIVFYNAVAVGILGTEDKPILSSAAMTAGGTASITWDASIPLSTSSYTRYRMINTNTPLAVVGRLFNVREATGPLLGTATYVGAHLVPRFNRFGYQWANIMQSVPIMYPAAQVLWSQNGKWPWFSEPIPVQINRDTGQILLQKPAVVVSADLAGRTQGLANGWPTTFANGLYYDVQVAVAFNRGDLNAYAPLPGMGVGGSNYQGTAYSKYGVTKTKVFPLDTWMWAGDQASLEHLAAERLKTMCDATIEGSIGMHYDAWTPTWDVFTMGYSLNIAIGSGASPLDGENLPVRSMIFRWPNEGADIHTASFRFSNRKAPFSGDSLYLHPSQFAGMNFGNQEGGLFIGGNIGGMSGDTDAGAYNASMTSGPDASSEGDFDAGEGGGDITAQGSIGEDWGLGKSGKHLSKPTSKDISDTPAARHRQMADEERDRPQREARGRAEEGRQDHAKMADEERAANRDLQKQRDQAPKTMRTVDRAAEYRDNNAADTSPPSMPLPGSTIDPDDIANGGG
jgi:hypothetical protein